MHEALRISLLALLTCGLVACSGSDGDGPGAGGGSGVGGTAGTGGVGGAGGNGGSGGHGGASGAGGDLAGRGGQGGAGGSGGTEPPPICVLGLCMEDPELAASCQETYDACVGRGHYAWACRIDADKTCDVFGETGPYY